MPIRKTRAGSPLLYVLPLVVSAGVQLQVQVLLPERQLNLRWVIDCSRAWQNLLQIARLQLSVFLGDSELRLPLTVLACDLLISEASRRRFSFQLPVELGRFFRAFVLGFGSLFLHFYQIRCHFVWNGAYNTRQCLFWEWVFYVNIVKFLWVIQVVVLYTFESLGVVGRFEDFVLWHLWLLWGVVVTALSLRLDRAAHSLVLAANTCRWLPYILIPITTVGWIAELWASTLEVNLKVVKWLNIDILNAVVGLRVVPYDGLKAIGLYTHQLSNHSNFNILTAVFRNGQIGRRMMLLVRHDDVRY